jgi:hypothetical protein
MEQLASFPGLSTQPTTATNGMARPTASTSIGPLVFEKDRPMDIVQEGCLGDGPFKNLTLHIGPFDTINFNKTRCLSRNFNFGMGERGLNRTTWQRILAVEDFTFLTAAIELPDVNLAKLMAAVRGPSASLVNPGNVSIDRGFHQIGHSAVGGEVCLAELSDFECVSNLSNRWQMPPLQLMILSSSCIMLASIEYGQCGKIKI